VEVLEMTGKSEVFRRRLIDFLSETERESFVDAVEALARIAGLTEPQIDEPQADNPFSGARLVSFEPASAEAMEAYAHEAAQEPGQPHDEDEHRQYLGDGVYASFDGYQIWLAKGRHDAPREAQIAIEPEVWQALVAYGAARWGLRMAAKARARPDDEQDWREVT